MKLVRFDHGATGIISAQAGELSVIDVAASARKLAASERRRSDILLSVFGERGSSDWVTAITLWEQVREALEVLRPDKAVSRPLSAVRLEAPLPSRTAKIFSLGGNFADHTAAGFTAIRGTEYRAEDIANEKDQGLPPWGFMTPATIVSGHDSDIVPPRSTQLLDYEGEVAVVLASGGRDLRPSDVKIWGVAAWNDLSVRDPHYKTGEAIDRGVFSVPVQKNWETGKPFGPWLVVDAGLDVGGLGIETRVNGEVRQSGNTKNMIYTFADAAAYLAEYMNLTPGDVVVSGTPAGTAGESGAGGPFLKDGDVVEVEVEDVGVLRNRVRRLP